MKVHGLVLDGLVGGVEGRQGGRTAAEERNRRWCSDGFEIGCDNGERVRVAFALDCCDREAMSFLATTRGVSGEDVRDLMLAAVEHRFGLVNRLPVTIEWLSDNGSCYVTGETRSFARDIGLEPRTTPIESPQSNRPGAVGQIDFNRASSDNGIIPPGCGDARPQCRTRTRDQLTYNERFDDIVIRAKFKQANFLTLTRAHAEHNNRDVRP